MSVYAIALVSVKDPAEYAKYSEGFRKVFELGEGELLSLDESPRIVEGAWPYTRTVLMKFPSEKSFKSWYDSEAYQAITRHRLRSASVNFALVSSVEDTDA